MAKIGDVVGHGISPCQVCSETHKDLVIAVNDDGSVFQTSWAHNGHSYHPYDWDDVMTTISIKIREMVLKEFLKIREKPVPPSPARHSSRD